MSEMFHLLKVDESINPAKPESHWLFEGNASDPQIGFVLRRESSGRVVYATSFGGTYPLGSQHYAVADQSGRHLGWFEVIGTHNHSTGEKRGEVPSKKVPYYVFK